VRKKVNDLLASGASYAMTLRALGDDNAVGVTSDSIRRHAERHFPVQNAARATYREILERRAKENSVDFVNGRPQPRRSLAQNIPANQRQKHRGASAVSRSWCV
jgi:hypothetical protein